MYFFRRNRFPLLFLALLVFCSIMVVQQYRANQGRHEELRDAFIFLYTKGYQKEADHIYQRLIRNVHKLSIDQLRNDFRATVVLVDATSKHPENLIWQYHWTISNEMEKRDDSMLVRALKLAGEN
jgi:hypothetical protein